MKLSILVAALLAVSTLAACDKPTVVTVPGPAVVVPGPAGPAGEQGAQGNDGSKGSTGNTGATGETGEGSTVIVMPPSE